MRLPVLLIFLQEPTLHFTDSLFFICFYFINFRPEFDYFLLYIPFGMILSFVGVFQCVANLLSWDLSIFSMQAFLTMNLTWSCPIVFGILCIHLHSILQKCKIFCNFLFSILTNFSFFESVSILLFLLVMISCFNAWWSGRVQSVISIFFVSVQTYLVSDYVVSFENDYISCWEYGIFFCVCIKCSVNIC